MNTRISNTLKRAAAGAALIAGVLALIWVFNTLRPNAQPAVQPGGGASATPLPAAIQSSSTPLPTQSEIEAAPAKTERVYTDPNRRFSVQIPAGWEVAEDGSLVGPDGFFRASYLADKASYLSVLRVCEAEANTPEGPSGVISLTSVQNQEACQITPLKTMSTNVVRQVVQMPTTQRHLRYLMIESDADHIHSLLEGMEFLNPAPPDATLEPAPEFYNGDGPFGSGDHIPYWPATAEPPAELTIEEHPIVEQSVDAPVHMEFFNRIPPEVLKKRASWREPSFARLLDDTNTKLEPFGTRLFSNGEDSQPPYTLYQNEELILDEITSFHRPSVSEPGSNYYDYALLVDLPTGESRLVQKEGITTFYAADSLGILPVFLGDSLLQVRWDYEQSQVQVLKDGEQIFAFASFFGVSPPVKGLWSWEGHWILEVDGFLIQDGAILNGELGFDEIFGWQLLNGKPFFFFRVGSDIGISYDGQVLPMKYDAVPHYECCEPAMFNNTGNEVMTWFYGLKEGTWHYIEIGVYPNP